MVALTSLIVPVLLSAVLVFVASSISHTLLPFHKADYGRVPAEDELMETLRRLGLPPGDYLFPRPGERKEMKEPAFQEKWKRGPVGLMTLMPGGGRPMGQTFGLWFVYCLAAGSFAAFVAARSLRAGASPREVFVLVAVVAAGAHVLALWPSSIWYGRAWGTTIRSSVDGIVYGLLTGGAFVWLWPK